MAVDAPRLALPLAGRWMQVPVDDPDRVAALVGMLRDGGQPSAAEDLERRIDALVDAGGDQLLLKQEPDDPQIMTWTWPPRARAATRTGLVDVVAGGSSQRIAATVTAIDHRQGYALVRVDEPDPPSGWTARTYAFGHPTSGRVLLITVAVPAEAAAGAWSLYDRVLPAVAWHDGDRDHDSHDDEEGAR